MIGTGAGAEPGLAPIAVGRHNRKCMAVNGNIVIIQSRMDTLLVDLLNTIPTPMAIT